MQQLEYTPSVCFNFQQTSTKRDMSAEFLFELSCTNQKNAIKTIEPNVNIIDLDQFIPPANPSKLKTQDFFEEFEHNFIVTFDEDTTPMEPLYKTGAFKQCQETSTNISPQIAKTDEDDLQKINICLLPKNSKSSVNKKSQNKIKNAQKSIIKPKFSSESTKQKDSPIQFQVKKRTVFKSKENITSNINPFKFTKKKIINQDTLDCLTLKAKSCKQSKPKSIQDKKCFTSQLVVTKNKKSKADLPFDNLQIETNRTSSIFLDHKQARESFRSTTLDNWKRKFQIQRKSNEQKTKKRTNIFQCPLQLR